MGNAVGHLLGGEDTDEHVPSLSVEVGEAQPHEGKARRNYKIQDRLVEIPFEDEPDVNTPFKVFQRSVDKFPERTAFGTREFLENGERGKYIWETYKEVEEQVLALGSGLKRHLHPKARVGIFSINRSEWMKAMLALWSQNLICVPLYDTLGAGAVEFIVNHCELTTIFCNTIGLEKLLENADQLPSVQVLVVFDEPTKKQQEQAAAAKWRLVYFPDLVEEGKAHPAPVALDEPDDLAYIMYTSGTTGDPKGVMLTHRNIIASASGLHNAGYNLTHEDVYLSYLPLAHSFEACLQLTAMCAGGSIGFYQGDTKLLLADVKELRPTIFAGVPRVYSRIYERVHAMAEKQGWIKKHVFDAAFAAQLSYVRVGQRNPLLDRLVFDKIAEQMGGRVRLMASGAAPLATHVMEFLKVAFKCPIYQGFGMTENAAAALVMSPGCNKVGTVGGPLPCTEVKLVDVPDMDYLTSNDPPSGEIYLRGPNVFKGYFQLEKETKEALTSDGWLKTGDIGTWEADGSLRIIDRKKNMFKLAQGEFVAAEELENVFSKSKYIAQIWVYGNSYHVCLVAIVVPDKEAVTDWASHNGVHGSFEEVCKSKELHKLIQSELETYGKEARLASFKIPKAVHIEGEINSNNQGFTIENDTLTPTFKLRRPQLLRRYQSTVDTLYQKIDA